MPYRAPMVAEALPPLPDALERTLEAVARDQGFAAFGIARADAAPRTAARLNQWLAEGCHGDMIWMESRAGQRGSPRGLWPAVRRSEEHTSELQSLMRMSYAVFCLKKKKHNERL